MNLKELNPLADTPVAALAEVDISALSEGAALILLAHRTGVKPKPEQVQAALSQPNGKPEAFYLVNVLPEYEFVYADHTVDGRRSRRFVGRMEAAAQELADAAAAFDVAGETVNLRDLAAVIKPRAYQERPRRIERETRELLIKSIASLTKELGHPPTIRQVAQAMGVSPSTVHHHVTDLKSQGLVAHDGQHTLRLVRHHGNAQG